MDNVWQLLNIPEVPPIIILVKKQFQATTRMISTL